MKKNQFKHEDKNQSIFLQAIYEGTIEIMGKTEADLIISALPNSEGGQGKQKTGYPSQIIADFENEFSVRFQPNTARGLLMRIGESSFPYLRKGLKKLNALGEIENRLIPISVRFEKSLQVLAELISELTSINIQTNKKDDVSFIFECMDGKMTDNFSTDLHLYYFMGVLRAFSVWLDSRKEYDFWLEDEKKQGAVGGKIFMKISDLE